MPGKTLTSSLQVSLENVPVMLWYTDDQAQFTGVSRKMLDFLPATPVADWLTHIHPADSGAFTEHFQTHFFAHKPFDFSFRLRNRQQEYRLIEGYACPQFDDFQDFTGYSGYCHLLQQEETGLPYKTVLDNLPLDVVIFSSDHKYRYVNPHAIRNQEVRTWILDKNDFEYVHHRQKDTMLAVRRQEKFEEMLATKSPVNWEETFAQPNGSTLYNLKHLVPFYESGNPVPAMVMGFGLDTTPLRLAEQLLRQSHEEILRIHSESDRFAYSVSHDLKSPLRSISGLLQVLEMESDPEEIHRMYGMIRKSIQKLEVFISDLVNYSRNARGLFEVQAINFKELIQEIFDQFAYLPHAEKITKTINVQIENHFFTDESRLRIVLNNLISNAINYHQPQRTNPFIEIKVQADEKEAVLEVSDNGKGMETKHLAKIFDMFYRVSHESPGSGLGLYIVREAINKLSGTIQVRSEKEVGTVFTIRLPNHVAIS
jgi:signal transduction histidine kinase